MIEGLQRAEGPGPAPGLRDQQADRLHAAAAGAEGPGAAASRWSTAAIRCRARSPIRCRCCRSAATSTWRRRRWWRSATRQQRRRSGARGRLLVLTVPYGYNHGQSVQDIDSDGIVDSLLDAANLISAHNGSSTLNPSTPCFSPKNTTSTKPAPSRPGCGDAGNPGLTDPLDCCRRARVRPAGFLNAKRRPPLPPGGPEKSMTELEFKSLATQGYNRIPLIAEAFADLETPLTLYLKLAQSQDAGKNTFLLESVVGGERFGRYSFIGLPARTLLRTQRQRDRRSRRTARSSKPTKAIRSTSSSSTRSASRSRCVRACRASAAAWPATSATTPCATSRRSWRDSAPKDDLGLPDIQLMLTEELAVIDNLSGKLYLIVYADPAPAGSLHARAPAPEGPARDAAPERRRARHLGLGAHRGRARLQQGGLPEGGGGGQGIRDGRRPDAGADRPAHPQALRRFAAVAVPLAAFAEPVAVHVLLQLRRHADRRLLARDPGAQRDGTRDGGRKVTLRPIAGTRTARRDAGTRCRAGRTNC